MKTFKKICSYIAVCVACIAVCGTVQAVYAKNAEHDKVYTSILENASIEESTINMIVELQKEVETLKTEVEKSKQELEIAEEKKVAKNASFKQVQSFQFPLDSKYRDNISSTQGLRTPIELPNAGGTTSGKYHNALDISVPDFTPVYAAKDGKVSTVYPSYYNGGAKYKGHPQYGGLIEIVHDDGTKTLYAHLSMTVVHEGDIVTAGQKIGHSGGVAGRRGSGTSTGPHLHFEVILNINDMISF